MSTKSYNSIPFTDPVNSTPAGGKTAKILMIIFACLLAVVLAIFVYVWIDRAQMISALTEDKITLEINLEQLRSEYEELQTSNDTLNVRLMEEREKVDILIERLKKTEATNRVQIRQYEQELGLLRDIMRSYVHQIDSLNTLNQQLRVETVLAKTRARESTIKYETLVKRTDNLTAQLEKGSVVQMRNIVVSALTNKDKETSRSRNTARLSVCFYLMENTIASRGPRNIYIRIKGPDKILLATDHKYFTVNNEQLIYSAMREVDYQGDDLNVCIYYGAAGERFSKGEYSVEVYFDGALGGEAQLLLK